MFPEDSDWFDNSGNEIITHDWTNAVQLAVDTMVGSTDDATRPAPTGTTMAWGGGKLLFWQYATGVGPTVDKVIDDSIDYTNRHVTILCCGSYSANALPGEVGWSGANGMGFNYPYTTGSALYTEDGATKANPPAGGANYITLHAAPHYLYADSANNGALTFYNADAVNTVYPFFLLVVSDQFPTRT